MTDRPNTAMLDLPLLAKLLALLLLVGALLTAGLWRSRNPRLELLPAADPLAQSPYPAWQPSPPTPLLALVAPHPPVIEGFSHLPTDAWWSNLVLQESGALEVRAVDTLRQPLSPQTRLIILTAAAVPLALEQLEPLEAFVRQGGVLVLERPQGSLATLAGAAPLVTEQTGLPSHASPPQTATPKTDRLADLTMVALQLTPSRSPTHAASPASDAPTTNQRSRALGWHAVRPFPLQPWQLTPEAAPAALARDSDGQTYPLLWSRRLGQGGVVGLSLELSRLLTAHVQGTPGEDFRFAVPSRTGALSGIPVPMDMAATAPDFALPVLDLLAQRLWAVALELAVIPGWWPFPDAHSGAWLCTHDEEGFGDKTRFMAEEEARRKVSATYFVLPEPMSPQGLAALRSLGAEVAHHWHRGFGQPYTRLWKRGLFTEQRLAVPLHEQLEAFRRHLPDLPPLSRVHGLQWDPDFDSTFRKLVAAGIRLDSSYGPIQQRGPYQAGSIRPFRPLDRTGQLLPILEQPFVLQDDEYPPQAVSQRVIQDAARHRLPAVPIFHVNTMAYKPSVGPLEAWLDGFDQARAADLWLGTLDGWRRFQEARATAGLRLVDAGEDSLTYEVQAPVISGFSTLPLYLPSQARGLPLRSVSLNGGPLIPTRCLPPPSPRALFAIPPGSHRLVFRYGTGSGMCPL